MWNPELPSGQDGKQLKEALQQRHEEIQEALQVGSLVANMTNDGFSKRLETLDLNQNAEALRC